MILLIDNYDSFSYNLYQMIGEIEPDIKVIRNDEMTIEEIQELSPDRIILSPGPGRPENAGIIVEAAETLGTTIPTLGVCLGHQAIGEAFGGTLTNLSEVFHGVATPMHIVANDYIYSSLPDTIEVGRYHSWVVNRNGLPECLEITGVSDEGYIMSLRHKEFDIRGIQYHPESVLTKEGRVILKNWIEK